MTLNELITQATLLKEQGFGSAEVKLVTHKDDTHIKKEPIKCLSTYGKFTVTIETL